MATPKEFIENLLDKLYDHEFTESDLKIVRNALKTYFDPENINITRKEYRELLERDKWLSCLEGAGVDNWEGYDCAIEMREQAYGGR